MTRSIWGIFAFRGAWGIGLGCLGLVAACVSPAGATTLDYSDARGEVLANVDIRGVTADLNSDRLRTTLIMRDITKSVPREIDVQVNTDSDSAPEAALVGASTGDVAFYRYSGGGWSEDRACTRQVSQVRNLRRNTAALSVPTGCLGEPTAVRVRVAAVNGSKSYDLAPVKGWSKPVTTSYPTLLTVSTPPSEVTFTPGGVYAYSGTVSGITGRAVQLQRQVDGIWTTVAATTTSSNQTYRMTYVPSGWTTQNAQMRVSVPAAGNQRSAITNPFWVNYVFNPSGPRVVTETVFPQEAVVYATAANGTGRSVLYRSDRPDAVRFVAWRGRLVETDDDPLGPEVRTQAAPGQPWVTLDSGSAGSCFTQTVATPNGTYVAWGAGTGTASDCKVNTIAVTSVGSDWIQRIPAGAASTTVELDMSSNDDLVWRVGDAVRHMSLSDGEVADFCPLITKVSDIGWDSVLGPLVRGTPPGEAAGYWTCEVLSVRADGTPRVAYDPALGGYPTGKFYALAVAPTYASVAVVGERDAADPGPYFDTFFPAVESWSPRPIPYTSPGSKSVALRWLTNDWLIVLSERVTVQRVGQGGGRYFVPRLSLTLPGEETFVGTYKG